MSIPLSANTMEITPPCLAEIENAPVVVLRHGTRLDRHELHFLLHSEGRQTFPQAELRKAMIEELRAGFESEDLDHNISRLEYYWQALDDQRSAQALWLDQVRPLIEQAKQGEEPDLPEAPGLDFDAREAASLELMMAEVKSYSRRISTMEAMNARWITAYPRAVLRMLFRSTTLEFKVERSAKVLTEMSCEELLAVLDTVAQAHGIEEGQAPLELLAEAQRAFSLSEEEEKNSSAPQSGSSAPKLSAAPSTSTDDQTLQTPPNTEPVAGSATLN